jgi:hypothetical protein
MYVPATQPPVPSSRYLDQLLAEEPCVPRHLRDEFAGPGALVSADRAPPAKSSAPVTAALRPPPAPGRFGTHDGPPAPTTRSGRLPRSLAAGGEPAGRACARTRGDPYEMERDPDRLERRDREPHQCRRDRDRRPRPRPIAASLLSPLTIREMLAFTVYRTEHHLRRVAERESAPRRAYSSGPHHRDRTVHDTRPTTLAVIRAPRAVDDVSATLTTGGGAWSCIAPSPADPSRCRSRLLWIASVRAG